MIFFPSQWSWTNRDKSTVPSWGLSFNNLQITLALQVLKFQQAACKPNFVEDDHSSRRRIAARAHSDLPAGCGAPGRHAVCGLRRKTPRLFGLAPCGVYP